MHGEARWALAQIAAWLGWLGDVWQPHPKLMGLSGWVKLCGHMNHQPGWQNTGQEFKTSLTNIVKRGIY